MNTDIAQRWADALRSGDYAQGRGVLRGSDDTYCCLGVLCELAVEDGVIDPPVIADHGNYCYSTSSAVLPEAVVIWAQLDYCSPLTDGVEVDDEPVSFVHMNDGMLLSFPEIADVVESTFVKAYDNA